MSDSNKELSLVWISLSLKANEIFFPVFGQIDISMSNLKLSVMIYFGI